MTRDNQNLLFVTSDNGDDAERSQFLKTEFAKFDLKEVIDELAWLRNSLNLARPAT